jgi:hypothetical protein
MGIEGMGTENKIPKELLTPEELAKREAGDKAGFDAAMKKTGTMMHEIKDNVENLGDEPEGEEPEAEKE